MQRRFLPALRDDRGRPGAEATAWEGWISPRGRRVDITGRINTSHPERVYNVDDRVGCYAILYRPGADNDYVAYVGYSKYLQSEIDKKYREFDVANASFPFTAVYVSNAAVAEEYELDLIRYYAPPWNTRFWKA